MAPDALAEMQRRYGDTAVVNDFSMGYDIVHFHNRYQKVDAPAVIQYHSEPGSRVDLNIRIPSLAISQYPAVILDYSMCRIVRNIIDIDNKAYTRTTNAGIRVGYAPSIKGSESKWFDKGYTRTMEILEEVARHRGDFSYDIITDVPLQECLDRKRECNIIIDQCVTPSFHRSALEGLAGWKMVICTTSGEIDDVTRMVSGAQRIPFENIAMEDLYNFLMTVDNDKALRVGEANRAWMLKYWNPFTIVKEFDAIYLEVINAYRNNRRNRNKSQWESRNIFRNNAHGGEVRSGRREVSEAYP